MANDNSKVEELLKDLIIVQLAVARVSGADIRKVVGVSMGRVTEILKVVNKARDE